jgi:hypothetical protein
MRFVKGKTEAQAHSRSGNLQGQPSAPKPPIPSSGITLASTQRGGSENDLVAGFSKRTTAASATSAPSLVGYGFGCSKLFAC